MALEFDPAGIAGGIMDTISGAGQYMLWSLLAIVIIGLGIWYFQHKHIVMVRHLNKNGTSRPLKDLAREVKVDGVTFWKLMKHKTIIPVPPAETLTRMPGNTLKFLSEMLYSEESGFIPLMYDVNIDNYKDKIEVKGRGTKATGVFKPFTPQQRSLFISQIRRAESRRKKTMLDTISQLAVPMVLAMIFLGVLLFWEDIAKPAKEISEVNLQMAEKNKQVLNTLSEISAQNARIVSAYTGEEIPVTQIIDGGTT